MATVKFCLRTSTVVALLAGLPNMAAAVENKYVFQAGHPSLQEWLLPDKPAFPADNEPNPSRVALGQKLFFDPRLSGDGKISCSTCHNPVMGWSDGLRKGIGFKGVDLPRASPTVINTAYNTIQMWDGRKKSLEDQAMGPMEAAKEMNMDAKVLFAWLKSSSGYSALFNAAYPGAEIGADTLSKAIASYERTIVSNNSPFDRWVKGDASAMTKQQVAGFELFAGKANCVACHSGSNFTDNGFHNIGLVSWSEKNPDMGRYAQKPIRILKGAFKTPTLRDIERTAPYFHDGSSMTLKEVVEHYNKGGIVKDGLDPNIASLHLSAKEQEDLVVFMQALTSPFISVVLPEIPLK